MDDFEDDLSDLIGGDARKAHNLPPSFKPRLQQAEERQDFTERCMACGGSGRWRGVRKCFKCDGAGKLVFRTSPEARAKGRALAAKKREMKGQADSLWRDDHKAELNWLRGAAERNTARGGDFTFPADLLAKAEQFGTLTEAQLAAVHRLMLRDAERAQAREAARPEIDCSKISESFRKARAAARRDGEDVAWLRLRLGAFEFSPDRQDPDNSVWIKASNGWVGKIIAGRFHRFKACVDLQQDEIAGICADPATAARTFGIRTKQCSCCGRTLTHPDSRAAGIGPICAERWGL